MFSNVLFLLRVKLELLSHLVSIADIYLSLMSFKALTMSTIVQLAREW